MAGSHRAVSLGKMLCHLFFAAFSLCFIIPVVLVVIVSFSSTDSVSQVGFSLFPKEFSLEAYRYVFRNPRLILFSYGTTVFVTVVGTLVSVTVTAMLSYALSRPDYRYARVLGFIVFFAMLFNAGMIPTYIVYTRGYHLKDSLLVLILPSLVNCWNVILMRTFLFDTPLEVLEAAAIDGSSELNTFWRVVIPMSKPILATIGLMTALSYWNQWTNSMIYIDSQEKYMLQYLLYRILKDAESMMKDAQMGLAVSMREFPTNSAKMAMAVIAAGPMMFVFPFFQKYFIRGLSSGAVKG